MADWIRRVANDERDRDALRLKGEGIAAQTADLVRRDGGRLVHELRATVTRDVEAFRSEFPDDAARDITVESTAADDGFAVRRPAPTAVSLTVALYLAGAALVCDYRFAVPNGLPEREDRIDVMLGCDGGETLQMKDGATGHVFCTADARSEFLLVPVLTARRR